jgi:alkylhydroperoxidase/carboxymuconolactone decarboxylase family protein YurZ
MSFDTKDDLIRLEPLLRDGLKPDCLPLGAIMALVSVGRFEALKHILRSLLETGWNPSTLQEILLQSHLFGGFPRAIGGLQIFDGLARDRGLNPHRFCKKNRGPSGAHRLRRGKNLFQKVYGPNTRAVLKSLHSIHPQYDRWILEDAYGRVLSRPFLSARTRELCAVAALTVMGIPKPLRSHIMGAIRLGASPEEVEGMIHGMMALVERKKIHLALEILKGLDLK